MGKKKSPRFETTFGEMMTGLGVQKLSVTPAKRESRDSPPAASPMGSRDRSEIQQLLDNIAELHQQRRALQSKLKSQEKALMKAAEDAALLTEKLRRHESVRQQDLKRMTEQRKALTELRQSNQTLRSQRDALQRRLDSRPAPTPASETTPPPVEGSDVRQAAWDLTTALRALDIDRLLIVGGSPSYHSQLQSLLSEAITLRLIDGKSRRNLKQARADLQWADLTVVWGGTILAHRVSELYSGESVVQIPHRGIVGMMRQLSESITG